MSKVNYTLFCDGGARGNPGPAASAALLYTSKGILLAQRVEYGGITTNNVAEYLALRTGLRLARTRNVRQLDCYLDSQLIVEQVLGRYKVKAAHLQGFLNSIQRLMHEFTSIHLHYVPRLQNAQADALVNQLLDSWQ